MARYNPELMMTDGGGDTVFAPATPKVDTRIALRKLQSGQPLTDDEKRSLGLPVASTTVTDTTVTDTTVTDTTASDAAAKATADAKALADAAAAKAAADAAAAAAKTAAEIAAAKAAQLAAEKALADAKAAADKAAADKTAQAKAAADTKAEEDKTKRKSAYDMLYEEFDRYGLGTLVSDIRNILVDGSLDPTEFSLKIRGTDAYKARFVANEARMAKGLRALSPADYIGLEDKYQEVMRQYGLPESYYSKTGTGIQEGFRKLIENDVSNIELEDRISTAQKRVINANPEVTQALKQFYPDITNADILAYTLDPKNAIENIKRKVTAAEIGGAAIQAGLQTGMTRAEELTAAGITKQQAQQGFQTVAEVAPRGGQLAEMYKQSPYTQTTAEAEVFGLAGSVDAAKQRKKLTSLETAAFSGSAGAGAIARDRAGVL